MNALFTSLVSILLSSSAMAYIPPSYFMMRKIAEPRTNLKSVFIRQFIGELTEDGIEDPRFREVLIVDFQKNTLESRLYDLSDNELYSVRRRLTSSRTGKLPILNYLLFETRPDVLANALKSRGIPVVTRGRLEQIESAEERRATEHLHLKRVHETIDDPKVVYWLVGENPKEPESHQFWLERDSFKPVRLVTHAVSSDSSFSDFRFEEYKSYGRFSYPSRILFYRDNLAVMGIQSTQVLTNPKMKKPTGAVAGGFTARGLRRGEDDKRFINEFYSLVR